MPEEACPKCGYSDCPDWKAKGEGRLIYAAVSTCKDRQIAKLREVLKEAEALAQKFVDKVESGRARSKETYAECKAFLSPSPDPGEMVLVEKAAIDDLVILKKYLDHPYHRCFVPIKGGFSAYVREFPGCIAEGESLQEAYNNLQETMLSWIEAARELGQEIPKPLKKAW